MTRIMHDRIRVILSPAKKMIEDGDTLPAETLPRFLSEAEELMAFVQALSYGEAKALWHCNDQLAELNFDRFRTMELKKNLTPALLAYEGIQYQYLAPKTLDEAALSWLSEHLRILSGFYGLLRPFDGVVPYRLEMGAKASVRGSGDLYAYWGPRLYEALRSEPGRKQEKLYEGIYKEIWEGALEERRPAASGLLILNLASKEYARAVEPYRKPEDLWIDCVFAERTKEGRLKQKATLAKMARGEMARFLAEQGPEGEAELLNTLPQFDRLGFSYSPEDSDGETYTFLLKTDQD